MKRHDDLKQYVNAWREVSPILEAMRDEELRNTPLPIALAQPSSMIDSAIFLKPLSDTSGFEKQLDRHVNGVDPIVLLRSARYTDYRKDPRYVRLLNKAGFDDAGNFR